MQAAVHSKVQVAKALSISFTSYALDKGVEFPFVTLPDFEMRAAKAMNLSDSRGIGWTPFVTVAQRGEWEKFTEREGPTWIRTSLDATGLENTAIPPYHTIIHGGYSSDGTSQAIDGPANSAGETLRGIYAPTW